MTRYDKDLVYSQHAGRSVCKINCLNDLGRQLLQRFAVQFVLCITVATIHDESKRFPKLIDHMLY